MPLLAPRQAAFLVCSMVLLAPVVLPAAEAAEEPRADKLAFALHVAPEGFPRGNDATETSIGYDREAGAALFMLFTTIARVSWDGAGTATWEDASGTSTSVTSLDPILWTDAATGRTFAVQLAGAGGILEITDDAGETWLTTQPPLSAPAWDHETIGGGPWPEDAISTPPAHLRTYPHAVYYCAQGGYHTQCARSEDGGLTWRAPVVAGEMGCMGLHGHLTVAPDGTVYLPLKRCGEGSGLLISRDAGLTWQPTPVPGTGRPDGDPSLAVDDGGRAYFMTVQNNVPAVSTSSDGGRTWTSPVAVNGHFPVANAQFLMATAGDPGRAAVAFYGTDAAGEDQDVAFEGTWHLYVAVTIDGGATWSVTNATPGDPVQRGTICMLGLSCSFGRNLLDFQGMTIDDEGRVLVGFADGCIDHCAGPEGTRYDSRDDKAVIARQSGGPRLRAAYDPAPGPLTAEAAAPALARAGVPIRLAADVWGGVPPYTFVWDLDEDGTHDDAFGAPVEAALQVTGSLALALRVVDSAGNVATSRVGVTVLPPTDAETVLWTESFDSPACDDARGWTVESTDGFSPWRLVRAGADGSGCAWYHGLTPEAGYPAGSDTWLAAPTSACVALPPGVASARLTFRVAGELHPMDRLAIDTRDGCGDGEWSVLEGIGGPRGDPTAAPSFYEEVSIDLGRNLDHGPFQIRLRIESPHLNHAQCSPVPVICSGYHLDDISLRAAVGARDPLAARAGGPYEAIAGRSLALEAGASGGRAPHAFAWDLDDDGAFVDAQGAAPAVVFGSPGDVVIRVRVSDADGEVAYAAADVTVRPSDWFAVNAGGRYDGEIRDPVFLRASSTGGVAPVAFAWDLDGDGVFDDAEGPGAAFVANDPGVFPVHVRAVDANGAVASAEALVDVSPPREIAAATWTFDGAEGCQASGWSEGGDFAGVEVAQVGWALMSDVGIVCAWYSGLQTPLGCMCASVPLARTWLLSPSEDECVAAPPGRAFTRVAFDVPVLSRVGSLRVAVVPCTGGEPVHLGEVDGAGSGSYSFDIPASTASTGAIRVRIEHVAHARPAISGLFEESLGQTMFENIALAAVDNIVVHAR